jgi:hypothetical protein
MSSSEFDVAALFSHGTRHRWEDGTVSRLDVVPVGEVAVRSGRVVVRDPAAWLGDEAEELEPFVPVVQAGMWRVTVSVVHWDESPDPLVPPPLRATTAIRVDFGESSVRRWEVGLRPGETLVDDAADLPGFAVDSGMGCLLDASDLDVLRHWQRSDLPKLEAILDDVAETMIVEDTDLTGGLLVFFCGMGDGIYPTWIGRDDDGDAVSLVIDLEMLSHSLGRVDTN